MKKWPLRFSADCDGAIWNIISSHNSNELLFEVRLDSEEIEYHRLNLKSFTSHRNNIPGIPWMSNVVFFTPELFVIQEFSEDHNPDQAQLRCYNWEGEPLWDNSTARLNEIHPNGLVLSSGEIINPASGQPALQRELIPGPALKFPFHYREGEEYFSEVHNFIHSANGEDPVRAIDYYEVDDRAIMAYYVKHERTLGLRLLGVNSEGKIEIIENLGDDLQGIADPTFLISERNIIFVKEKQHFFVYGIPE